MPSFSTTSRGDRTFVIGTGNPGKRREFEALLDDFWLPEWEIYDRQNFPDDLTEVEETGATFRENAIKKAMKTAAQSGCCALADDSGLEVDALGGAPGVRSARFAGEEATDDDNNRLLVERLQDVGEENRTARFVAVVCVAMPETGVARTILARRGLVRDDIDRAAPRRAATPVRVGEQVVVWFRGTVEGRITDEPAGGGGFGYDPHFYVPHLGKCMAELSMDEKNQVSHRADAARQLVELFPGRARSAG